jgi:hypothetical protein
LQTKDWFLCYSPIRNGYSFLSFLARTNDAGPQILVIKNNNGEVFGAFVTEGWQIKSSFFG